MQIESRETVDPREGVARHWRVGNCVIEWYIEKPPQSWFRLDANVSIRWYSDD